MDNGETVYLKNRTVYGDTDSLFVCFQCIENIQIGYVNNDSDKQFHHYP